MTAKLPDYFASQKHITPTAIEYVAMEIDLTAAMIAPDKSFTVFADVINLPANGNLVLHGLPIRLIAREINANGCTIDTSGGAPDKSFTSGDAPRKAKPGQRGLFPKPLQYLENGAKGKPGAAASHGKDAGDILIVAETIKGALQLKADGGIGGRGQDGGQGGDGALGWAGVAATADNDGDITPPTKGWPGGDGGKGGTAGQSGNGGNGGHIAVASCQRSGKLTKSAKAGPKGPTAKPGAGGAKGDGGQGGQWMACHNHWIGGSSVSYCNTINKFAASGANGKTGKSGDAAASANPGKAFAPEIAAITDYSDFYKTYPVRLAQREIALHAADLHYMSGDYKQALTLYEWLEKVTPADSKDAGSLPPVPWKKLCATVSANHCTYFYLTNGKYYQYNLLKGKFDAGPNKIDIFGGMAPYGKDIIAVADYQKHNGHIYFFLKKGRYVRFNVGAGKTDSGLAWTAGGWKGTDGFEKKIVAALTDEEGGYTYFLLSNAKYLRFNQKLDRVDEGPKPLDDLWPGMSQYGTKICAAVNWDKIDGNSYFFLDDGSCVRFANHEKLAPEHFMSTGWEESERLIDPNEWVAMHDRVVSQKNRLAHGMGYFGEFTNHVPVVSLGYYQSALDSMVTLAKDIEGQANTYVKQAGQLAKQRTVFEQSFVNAQNAINRLNASLAQTITARTALGKEIDALGVQQQAMSASLTSANAAFQKAVENRLPNCSFMDILNAVVSIVQIAGNFEDGYGEIEAMGKLESAAVDARKYIAKLAKLGKAFKEMQKNWASVKGAITAKQPDGGKLVASAADFDKKIQPYLNLPAARAYKKQVHAFVNLIKARNAKLVKYNEALIGQATIEAEIKQRNAALARIRANWAEVQDPSLAHNRSYMLGLIRDAKSHLLRYLYQENQAFQYWALTKNKFATGDETVAEMAKFHLSLKGKILNRMNAMKSPKQTFPSLVYSIDADGRQDAFAEFLETGTINFAFADDDPLFQGFAHVMISGVTIDLVGAVPGKKQQHRIYAELTQNGASRLFAPDGTAMDFSHEQRMAPYAYYTSGPNKPSGGNLGGGGGAFIGVSPFASWTLTLPKKDNKGIDLSKVSRIDIALSGSYVASKNTTRSKQARAQDCARN